MGRDITRREAILAIGSSLATAAVVGMGVLLEDRCYYNELKNRLLDRLESCLDYLPESHPYYNLIKTLDNSISSGKYNPSIEEIYKLEVVLDAMEARYRRHGERPEEKTISKGNGLEI